MLTMPESLRALYAEDNPLDADLTREFFLQHASDITLVIACSGSLFLSRLDEAPFDVLIVDQFLPDIDGLALVRILADRGCRIPVVMVTGLGDEDLVVKALGLGVGDYVPKSGNYL